MKQQGVHQPEVENKASIKKHLNKKNIKPQTLYTFDSALNFARFIKKQKGLPRSEYYNQNGLLINFDEDKACFAKSKSFIKTYKINSSKETLLQHFSQEAKKWQNLDGVPADTLGYKNADLTLVYYYANFAGRMNRNHIIEIEKEIKTRPDIKINFIVINSDVIETWKDIDKITSGDDNKK